MKVLLSTAYFGPIQYYSKICSANQIYIEAYEHFAKQTFRNRCVIYGSNGPLSLTVPIMKGNEIKIYTKDIRIDYSSNWQKIHFKAIESAYRNSPYYEFYIDEILPAFDKKYNFLVDLNMELQSKICDIIGFKVNTEITDIFHDFPAEEIDDYRFSIHPKAQKNKADPKFDPPIYRQVFEEKSGFIENLSILDLLFNTGPDTKHLLIKSKKAVPCGTA